MSTFRILPIVTALALSLAACNRNPDELVTTDPDPSSAKTSAEATKAYDDIAVMTEEAVLNYMEDPNYDTYTFGPCVVVTVDSVNTVITFDLGSAGCTGLDGHIRKGKIIVDYNGVPRQPGSTLAITLDAYSVDGYQVSGSLTYNAIAENAEGDLELVYRVSDGEYIEPDGDVVTFECARSVVWTEGAGSENLYDDVFTTSGSFTATINGDAYSGTTSEPIVFASACWTDGVYYPVAGQWELIFPDGIYRAINYGDGDCDKIIVITIANRDYTYNLP